LFAFGKQQLAYLFLKQQTELNESHKSPDKAVGFEHMSGENRFHLYCLVHPTMCIGVWKIVVGQGKQLPLYGAY